MRQVCEKLGFTLDRDLTEPLVRARIDLDATAPVVPVATTSAVDHGPQGPQADPAGGPTEG